MSDTFFGLQIALTAFHKDPFRRRLHEVIASPPAEQSLQIKRARCRSSSSATGT
jgi:hypothetical protein